MQKRDLALKGEFISKAMAGSIIRNKIQIRDEHQLLASLHERFRGYDEVKNIKSVAQNAFPYLPYYGALGEMVPECWGFYSLLSERGRWGQISVPLPA